MPDKPKPVGKPNPNLPVYNPSASESYPENFMGGRGARNLISSRERRRLDRRANRAFFSEYFGKKARRKVSARPDPMPEGASEESKRARAASVKARVNRKLEKARARTAAAGKAGSKLSVYGTISDAVNWGIRQKKRDDRRRRGLIAESTRVEM